MPSVRCPSCHSAQHVEAGSVGYTCSECGKEWGFVVCRNCGARFHSKPGATTWTCPRCGLLQEASPEPPPPAPPEPAVTAPTPMRITDADLDRPQEPAGSAFPPGLGLGDDGEGPQDAFAMPVRESEGRSPWIYVAVGVAVLVVVIVLFNLVFGGDDGASEPPGGGQVSGEEATATMCGHVQQINVLREGALTDAAEQLRADAAALKQADEPRTAKQVRALVSAIEDARRALANQRPTAEAYAAFRTATKALPCGPGG